MDKQLEITTELRRARTWILAVGIVIVVIDMIMVYGFYIMVHGAHGGPPGEVRLAILIYDLVVLGLFFAMWALAKHLPVAACVAALSGFWAIQLVLFTLGGPSEPLPLKLLYTLALIRAIKSATRAERLKKEIAQIFD